ncbi:MAG: lamin tail domain-containing protein [Bacteroidota bacterium]
MRKTTFIWILLLGVIAACGGINSACAQNLVQSFEDDFTIQSFPDEFLPDWYGNEVRSTSSRIFQLASGGLSASRALAVQPISTFDGELIIKLYPQKYEDPKIQFWARSLRNGSGSRPALVSYSFSNSLEQHYGSEMMLAENMEFANEDQEFRKFEILLTQEQKVLDSLYLKISVRYGPGSGSCARWLMDDFEFGDIEEDLDPPFVVNVRGYSANQLEVQFSERLDPVFSQIQLNYDLEGLEPRDAELKLDSLVLLTFEKELESGKSYDLSLRQVADLSGNFLRDTVVSFSFFDPTAIAWKDLVINEIMPAPREGNGLPNVEYVELFHAGDKVIRTGGLLWSNSRNTVSLENYWISPGEYILLIPDRDSEPMKIFGRVIPVSSWPTLLNGGDELKIESAKGELIDRISYSSDSWGGSEFSGGGYSLELVNPFLLCDQSLNLLPSQAPLRGSPGIENAVFDPSPDTTRPRVVDYFFTKENELIIRFSELIQPVFSEEFLQFEEPLGLDSIWVEGDQVFLLFAEAFPENSTIQLEIAGFLDCSGNVMERVVLQILRPSIAQEGEVFLNEVLYNAKIGSPKFVELANPTEKFLEIASWKLANINNEGLPNQIRILSERSLVMPPRSFLAISTDTNQVQLDYPMASNGNFHQIASLPSYPIAGGTVVLLDPDEKVVEQFSYDDDLHHPLLQDSKGVSLERISWNSPAGLAANWHSASASVGFASPGMVNSQFIPEEFESEIIQIDPPAFDPEGSNGNTFVSIRYELDQAGWVGSFRIYDMAGRMLAALAENEILATQGLYTWTGTDNLGRRMRSGYYVLLVELFDLDGRIKTIRKTIIIAERL